MSDHKFEVGKKYFASDSFGDGSISEYLVTKRSNSFCTVEQNGKPQKAKIRNYAWHDGNEECLHLSANYSLYAKKEVGNQAYTEAKERESKGCQAIAQMMGVA